LAPEHWEGNYVFLEVSDTGSGMSTETLARIFEPFFTTKFTGRGLGLAAVLGIVRGHRGALKVTSTLGDGSKFALAFPAVASAAEVHPAASAQAAAHRLNATVLVIDDEASVRRIVTRVLEALGCRAVAAPDGTVGVEMARDRMQQFDLVILDLTMPLMDGVQTLQELRRLHTDLPVILMSGFAEAHARARFGEHGLAGFLQKPFTVEQVRDCVTSALAARERATALKAG
jgi:CheY-like chemotaxis protein